jgi:hypothetical protein
MARIPLLRGHTSTAHIQGPRIRGAHVLRLRLIIIAALRPCPVIDRLDLLLSVARYLFAFPFTDPQAATPVTILSAISASRK